MLWKILQCIFGDIRPQIVCLHVYVDKMPQKLRAAR